MIQCLEKSIQINPSVLSLVSPQQLQIFNKLKFSVHSYILLFHQQLISVLLYVDILYILQL